MCTVMVVQMSIQNAKESHCSLGPLRSFCFIDKDVHKFSFRSKEPYPGYIKYYVWIRAKLLHSNVLFT
jgi:hypothetical protein